MGQSRSIASGIARSNQVRACALSRSAREGEVARSSNHFERAEFPCALIPKLKITAAEAFLASYHLCRRRSGSPL